jgi:uncharacterized LabA/DUF88 family protein
MQAWVRPKRREHLAAGCVSAAASFGVIMKVCVFVDGENFRHSVVELFPDFHQENYLPKLANWAELFDWIVKVADESGERIRTYWYVIDGLDFYPRRIYRPNQLQNLDKKKALQELLSKNGYEQDLNRLEGKALDKRMTDIVNEINRRRENLQSRFNGWLEIQNSIAQNHKAIEFRRAGSVKCNLFTNTLGSEKAVDVKLATDLIVLKDIYELAIIVSGDQDYVPAVQVLKDCGKRVVNVSFQTRSGKLLPGGARRLNQVTDWSCEIPYTPLAERLKIQQIPLKEPSS